MNRMGEESGEQPTNLGILSCSDTDAIEGAAEKIAAA